jgi:hypothetical protein
MLESAVIQEILLLQFLYIYTVNRQNLRLITRLLNLNVLLKNSKFNNNNKRRFLQTPLLVKVNSHC